MKYDSIYQQNPRPILKWSSIFHDYHCGLVVLKHEINNTKQILQQSSEQSIGIDSDQRKTTFLMMKSERNLHMTQQLQIELTAISLHVPAEFTATSALEQLDRMIVVIKVNAIVLQKHISFSREKLIPRLIK